MAEQSANFYGKILVVLVATLLIGLFTTQPSTTGFVVKETETSNFFDVQAFEGDTRTCADGSLYGECSTLIKPKYCIYGELADYCELCGCNEGEICRNRECISP